MRIPAICKFDSSKDTNLVLIGQNIFWHVNYH